MHQTRLRLGQLLVDARILTPEQLEQVLALQRVDGRRLGTLLVEIGLVTETQLTQILSQQLSVPWVSLYHIDFSRGLLSLVPRETAEKYCLVPIYVRPVRGLGDTLYVAMDDPMNEEALSACSSSAGLPTRAMIAAPSDIRKAIRLYYAGVRSVPRVARAAPVRPPPVVRRPIDVDALEEVEPQPLEDSSPPPASSGAKPTPLSDRAALGAFLTPSGSMKVASVAHSGPGASSSGASAAVSRSPAVEGATAREATDQAAGPVAACPSSARGAEQAQADSDAVALADPAEGQTSATAPVSVSDVAISQSTHSAVGNGTQVSYEPGAALGADSGATLAADPNAAGAAEASPARLAEAYPGPLSEAVAAASSQLAASADEAANVDTGRLTGPAEATEGGDVPSVGASADEQTERARAAQVAFGAPTEGSTDAGADAKAGGAGSEETRRARGVDQDLVAALAMGVTGAAEPPHVAEPQGAGMRGSSWDVPASRNSSQPVTSRPADDDAPEVEAHEIELPKRPRGKRLSLTLLDGTTIPLGPLPAKRSRPAPGSELNGIELIALLKAAYRTRPGKEGSPEELRGEKILAALLALLVRKHVISEAELIEEVKKL